MDQQGTDLVEIRGLKLRGRHGVTEEERANEQPLVVNLAARLVSLSNGADVVVSGEVLADPEVAELDLRREPLQASLKGFDEPPELWRVR